MTMPVYRWPWEQLSVATEGWKLDPKQALNDPTTSDKFRAQILSNGRWRTTFTLPTNNYLDTNKARNIQLSVNGFANRMKLPDFSRLYPKGSAKSLFPELVSNSLFSSGLTGWTLTNNDVSSRITTLQKLKLVAAGASAPFASSPLTVVASTSYLARVFLEVGTASACAIGIGTTANANDIASLTGLSVDGYYELPFNSGAHTTLYVNVTSTGGAGIYSLFNMISVSQVMLVHPASQSGGLLAIENGPASTQGVLLAGDLIEISNHPYEVVSDFDTNSSGIGTIEIAPVLRSSPSDGQSIITNVPMFIAMMKSPINLDITPGPFGSFSFECIEDLLL